MSRLTRLQGRCAFEARGPIELKGRGPMNIYFPEVQLHENFWT
jgi:hypothetical protein